ncbi:energy transducer TonB [Methylomagnum ishizawai]|uniref:energy transducer TonB n=1 Tax=Methylomagnum ishizawai TaxID=1760988 RepID=UPI001C33B001|nr:energy transducer TonB [Methylomagnum ishizawai]BBL73576.1 hypothetical protein MishRS11D_06740 [Methylomagnum ishizawai]
MEQALFLGVCRLIVIALMVLPTIGAAEPDHTPEFVLEREPLAYPAEAAQEGVEGHVMAEIAVAEDGGVAATTLVESVPPGVFDAAVRDWAKGWRFKPVCGRAFPHGFKVKVPVYFVLPEGADSKPMLLEPLRPVPPRHAAMQADGKVSLRRDPACGADPGAAR